MLNCRSKLDHCLEQGRKPGSKDKEGNQGKKAREAQRIKWDPVRRASAMKTRATKTLTQYGSESSGGLGKLGYSSEDLVEESEDEEQDKVRESLMDIEHDGHLEYVELNALRKIQKSVRRNRALGRAVANNHWKLFSQVDTLEENETMHMATFLQNLIQLVPGAKELDEDCAGGRSADVTEKAAQEILLEELDIDMDEIHVGTNIKVVEKVEGSTLLFSFKGAMNPMKAQETIAMMRGTSPRE